MGKASEEPIDRITYSDRAPDLFALLTMDCEPPHTEVTPHAARMSGSGPADYAKSERAIRGYAEAAGERGYPVTLFLHPEVATAHRELLLELQSRGACLGMHLHPYKLGKGEYGDDLGAYSASGQRDILKEAVRAWEKALGQEPRYFRPGYFSANDATFAVLLELGFRGGSLSNPGRVLPQHCSVWAGAEPYPHRAHLAFRQIKGDSDFIEIPVSADFERPVEVGDAHEQGYEWPYLASQRYDHRAVIADVVARVSRDAPRCGTIVTDVHNDQDFSPGAYPARTNLDLILESIEAAGDDSGLNVVPTTIDELCKIVLEDSA